MKKIIFFCSCLTFIFFISNTYALNEQPPAGDQRSSQNNRQPATADPQSPAVNNISTGKKVLPSDIEFIDNAIADNNYYTALGYISSLLENIQDINSKTLYNLYLRAGASYMNLGLYNKAEEYYMKAVSTNKKPLEAYQELQRMGILRKKYSTSIKYYKYISGYLKTDNVHDDSHYFAMIAYYSMNNYKKCLSISEGIFSESSEVFPYAQYIRALAVMRTGSDHKKNVSNAVNILKGLISGKKYTEKFMDRVRLTIGMIMFEEGNYMDSIKQFERLNKSFYSDDALYGIIWNYIKLKKYDMAFAKIDDFLSYYRESSHYEDILMLKGQLYKKIKKFKESIGSFERAKEEFNSVIYLVEKYMMNKKYLQRLSSLFEVTKFPAFRYAMDFKYLKLKSKKIERYNEKRVLKGIARKEYVYNSLLQMIRIRRIADSLDSAKIRYRSFSRRYDYNIINYKSILKSFRKEIKNLKNINISNIKEQINGSSSSIDIRSFVSQREKFILEELESQLGNISKFLSYVESIVQLMNMADMDKTGFFKQIQEIMLQAPVFSSSENNIKEKIIRSLDPKKELDITLTDTEENFLTDIEGVNKKLRIISQMLNSELMNAASSMFRGEEAKKVYWQERHKKVKSVVSKISGLAASIEGKLFSIKVSFGETIREHVKNKRIVLAGRLKKIEERINKLEVSSNLLIMHIDSLIEEMKPMKRMMAKTADMMRSMENEYIRSLQTMTDYFRDRIMEEVRRKIKEYKALIEEADYEIADSLFYVTTGG